MKLGIVGLTFSDFDDILSQPSMKAIQIKGVVSSIREERRIIAMANKKQTSKPVATKASQILRDGRYSSKSKSVAGSALSKTKKGK